MLNFNLDLQKQDNFSKAFTARMGDVGEQFSVTLFDNQTPYTPVSGDAVSFRVVTPSGKFASVAGTMSGNKATFTLNGQITSEAGYYQRAYVAVSNGTKLRTTQDLIFFSLGNSDINRGQADYYVAELDKLLQQLNEEFDEWLADREQDYSDLLARIVDLNNRVTGLETTLDEILAQLQATMINTKNIFDSSLIVMPEAPTRRRVNGQTIDTRGWGSVLVNNANTMAMFEPNKTYHIKYVAELLTLTGGELTNAGQFGLAFYSGKTGFPSVWLPQSVTPAEVADMKVGDTIVLEKTFTTPAGLHDPEAAYQILSYGRRDTNGVIDLARFHDIMIQEGSMFTGFQTNPDNTLTKFDENRLKKSILVDPKMTGLNPPTIENDNTEVTFLAAGVMQLKNLLTNSRTRVFWTSTKLGLDSADALGAFEIRVKMRQVTPTAATMIEMGYSGGADNATFNVDTSATWQVYTAVIKPNVNSAFCIFLPVGVTLQIQELYIYPASTDVTSKRVERIETETAKVPAIEKVTTGTPDTVTGIDANTYFNSGIWKVYSAANMPQATSGTYFYLRVINFNVNNCIQFASLREGAGLPSNPNYVRQCVNGNWQEWRFIPTLPSDKRVDTYAVDFDTLKETGVFVNTSATNSPDGAASTSWYTEVIRYGSSGNYVYQRVTKISNVYQETYERQLFNGAWSAWRRISAPYIDQILGTASDANKITTTQNIQLEATSTANLPTSGTGVYYYLEVIARADNYVLQRATLRGATFKVYVRQSHNGVWSAWREMAFV